MPDIRLYQSALQHPEQCFTDEELKTATVAKKSDGWMPLAWAGQFAVVFKLNTSNGPKAVRCFYHPRTEHEDRYKLFYQHIQAWPLSCLARFEYQPEGIRLNGDCYPIVKMEWVAGETLDKRVEALVENKAVSELENLSLVWLEVVNGLRRVTIAHGDMQHGNILSENGSLRLVDYDGVFIPSFQGKKPLETGHRNYQHPERSQSESFGLHIDYFSSFVIYLSIKALAVDPKLWKTFHQDDYLILKQDDYAAPQKSQVLKTLKKSSDAKIRDLAHKLEELCVQRVDDLPAINSLVDMPTGSPWWSGLKEVHPVPGPVIFESGASLVSAAEVSPMAPPAPYIPLPAFPHPAGRERKKNKWIVPLVLLLLFIAACLVIFIAALIYYSA